MPTNTTAYSIGDAVRLGVVVKSTAGTPTNTAVTLIINTPSTKYKYGPISSTASTVIDNTTTGTWRHTFITATAGRHTYEWRSTGAVTVTTGGAFAVRPNLASS